VALPLTEQSEKSASPGEHRLASIQFREPQTAAAGLERIASKISSSLAGALPALLAESPDPDSALLLFERLVTEASPELLHVMEEHPFLAHYAIAVLAPAGIWAKP